MSIGVMTGVQLKPAEQKWVAGLIDAIESVGGTVALGRSTLTDESKYMVPTVCVQFGDTMRMWQRPTYTSGLQAAVEWLWALVDVDEFEES